MSRLRLKGRWPERPPPLTVATMFGPRGGPINGVGVVPHVLEADAGRQLDVAIAKAIELAKKYPNIVEYVIVGNECLDQDFADGPVSVDQLIADINKVKQSVPANVKVTTCLGLHSGLHPQKIEDGSPNPLFSARWLELRSVRGRPGRLPCHAAFDCRADG